MDTTPQETLARRLRAKIRDVQSGSPGAFERLDAALRPRIRRDVAHFLGAEHAAIDDVVQDTLLRTMRYLEGDVEFSGDPLSLALTVARNRCRDLLRQRNRQADVPFDGRENQLPDERPTLLDRLEQAERHALLQQALERLDPECRELLRALFVDGLATETVRRRLGLGTVQAIYHRKAVCLEKLGSLFQDLADGRSSSGGNDRGPGGGGERDG